ncbi:MAG: flagellar type III secretion system protein FliR [Tissierellia bacterium]|nr:flagellar type III secretion system protein FliR [Tissierellia bacterium]
MGDVFQLLFTKYEIFLLVLTRVSGIFIISPFFSSQNVPNTIKIGFSFILSILISLSFDINYATEEITFVAAIAKELIIGLIIGFISYMFFTIFYIMGQLIDMKIGFGMVNVMDPQHRVQVPLMGNFYYILAFLILFTINGHHIIINAVVDSFNFIPIGKFTFEEEIAYFLINILSNTFVTGFKLAMPVIAVIFLIDVLLGILARTIPQMNVFVVGMPFKILIGLLIVSVSIPIFYSITTGIFNENIDEIYYFLKSFIKG